VLALFYTGKSPAIAQFADYFTVIHREA